MFLIGFIWSICLCVIIVKAIKIAIKWIDYLGWKVSPPPKEEKKHWP